MFPIASSGDLFEVDQFIRLGGAEGSSVALELL